MAQTAHNMLTSKTTHNNRTHSTLAHTQQSLTHRDKPHTITDALFSLSLSLSLSLRLSKQAREKKELQIDIQVFFTLIQRERVWPERGYPTREGLKLRLVQLGSRWQWHKSATKHQNCRVAAAANGAQEVRELLTRFLCSRYAMAQGTIEQVTLHSSRFSSFLPKKAKQKSMEIALKTEQKCWQHLHIWPDSNACKKARKKG